MALIAKLDISGKSYNILECEYEFYQDIDKTGRPSDRPRGGIINLVLVSTGNSDLIFHEWMKEKYTTKEGVITLTINVDKKDVPKTIQFEDAYCIRLFEQFSFVDKSQMLLKISILAGKIIFGDSCEFLMFDK
jgi:hypothetical protein